MVKKIKLEVLENFQQDVKLNLISGKSNIRKIQFFSTNFTSHDLHYYWLKVISATSRSAEVVTLPPFGSIVIVIASASSR